MSRNKLAHLNDMAASFIADGYRLRALEVDLARLAVDTGLEITRRH
jgi:hypothetical protein